ncbi:MAG TPA: signal peptidase II [Solirubrobacteraceae bacterium]|nr:signal peptidase II [Solirubrobacteraceae bacterium]
MSATPAWSRAALVLALVLVADQATKALVRHSIDAGDSERVMLGARIVHVTNDGVAFGALAGSGLVLVVVLAALAGLIAWFARNASRPLVWLPTGLLLGGALGNVLDRVRAGAVTDFVKLPAWPAFNLADTAITFGVLTLLLVLERSDGTDDAV